jgi:two-component system sensor histidine kinase HydH
MKPFKNISIAGFTAGIPPLILIDTILVLFPIFAYMTIDRINRHNAHSVRLLIGKSTALIRAFEAGTRTGMMNMGWSRNALETLLQETAALPDIAYLFIVGRDGTILAHNNRKEKGNKYGLNLNLAEIIDSETRTNWRIIKNGKNNNVFEVYKKFSPIVGQKAKTLQRMEPMHHASSNA